MLCNAASCVHLKGNNGGLNLLVGVLMSYFIVVTIHEVCDFCWRSSLLLSVFDIFWPLSRD